MRGHTGPHHITFHLISYERVIQEIWPGKSLTGVFREHPLQKVLERGAHVFRPFHRVFDDKTDQLEDAGGEERRRTCEQLVQDTSQSPEVKQQELSMGKLLKLVCHLKHNHFNKHIPFTGR